jgi:hypothetical protein
MTDNPGFDSKRNRDRRFEDFSGEAERWLSENFFALVCPCIAAAWLVGGHRLSALTELINCIVLSLVAIARCLGKIVI